MADVFISYAREDHAKAEMIARGLGAMGLECFWDTDIPPGQTWADYIENKLAACKAVIVLWSQHSTRSQWVREEARMGRDRGHLIPAILDGSSPPLGFGEVQAADLTSWRGEPNHPQWTRLSQAVYGLARGASAPPPQAQAQPQPQPQPQPEWRPPPPAPQAAYAQPGGAAAPALSPIAYVQKCLRLFIDGKGRARRAEYWWWTAFSVLVSIAATVLDYAFGVNAMTGRPNATIISSLASLALLAPGVSVMSRRFHDVGLSGWLVLAFLGAYFVGGYFYGAGTAATNTAMLGVAAVIFLAAGVTQLVITLIPSRSGTNQYGPNPKEHVAAVFD